MICWKIELEGFDPFTFITGYCHTEAEVREAVLEKFCRPAKSVIRL